MPRCYYSEKPIVRDPNELNKGDRIRFRKDGYLKRGVVFTKELIPTPSGEMVEVTIHTSKRKDGEFSATKFIFQPGIVHRIDRPIKKRNLK